MNKKMVFVVQIDATEDVEDSVRKSIEGWMLRAKGAYAAKIQVDEVKLQEE